MIRLETGPSNLITVLVIVLYAEPLYRDIVVRLHEGPREESLEWLGQVVPADDVPRQVLAVRIGIADANVCDNIVRVPADALVRQDCKADTTEAY